jgi:hypothetical protein
VTDEPPPWWLRALEPLRSEASMFRVFLAVLAFIVVLVVLIVLIRAL